MQPSCDAIIVVVPGLVRLNNNTVNLSKLEMLQNLSPNLKSSDDEALKVPQDMVYQEAYLQPQMGKAFKIEVQIYQCLTRGWGFLFEVNFISVNDD